MSQSHFLASSLANHTHFPSPLPFGDACSPPGHFAPSLWCKCWFPCPEGPSRHSLFYLACFSRLRSAVTRGKPSLTPVVLSWVGGFHKTLCCQPHAFIILLLRCLTRMASIKGKNTDSGDRCLGSKLCSAISCVTLGKPVSLSVPWSPHL